MKKKLRYGLLKSKGFTLVEILVVVSIIAILVTIVIVYIGKSSRINSRKAAFKSDTAAAARLMVLQCDDATPNIPADTSNTIWQTKPDGSANGFVGTPSCGPISDGLFSIEAYPESEAVKDGLDGVAGNADDCVSATVSQAGANFGNCP